jgi:hypothetical protein
MVVHLPVASIIMRFFPLRRGEEVSAESMEEGEGGEEEIHQVKDFSALQDSAFGSLHALQAPVLSAYCFSGQFCSHLPALSTKPVEQEVALPEEEQVVAFEGHLLAW